MKKLSGFLTLNVKDFIKGLIMAVLGAVIAVLGPTIESGEWVFNWSVIWKMAAGTAFAYIVKNLFTNNKDELLKKDDPAVTQAEKR